MGFPQNVLYEISILKTPLFLYGFCNYSLPRIKLIAAIPVISSVVLDQFTMTKILYRSFFVAGDGFAPPFFRL